MTIAAHAGDIENEDEILEWLLSQLEKDEIEDVTDEMLDRLIKDGKTLAVLFCKSLAREPIVVCARGCVFGQTVNLKIRLRTFAFRNDSQTTITIEGPSGFSMNWRTSTTSAISSAWRS